MWICVLGYTQEPFFNRIVLIVETAAILLVLAHDVHFWITVRELLTETLATVVTLDTMCLKIFIIFVRVWYNSRCSKLKPFLAGRSSDFCWLCIVIVYVGILVKCVSDSLKSTLRLIHGDDFKHFATFCELYSIVIRAQFVTSIAIASRAVQHFREQLKYFGSECVQRGRAHEICEKLSAFNEIVSPLLRVMLCVYFTFLVCHVSGTLFLTFSCDRIDRFLTLSLSVISTGLLLSICKQGEEVVRELKRLRRLARRKQLFGPDLRSEMFLQEAIGIQVTKGIDLGAKGFFEFLGFSMTFAVIVFQSACAIVPELCLKLNTADASE